MNCLKYIRFVLLPLALLYGVIIRIRNFLFNIEKIKSEQFNVPVISVGNITVGGTGKTPLTEFIIRTISPNNDVALLSRGYKRETKGVVLADEHSTALDIGDEPKQILDKFKQIKVAVAEKRVEGINALLSLQNKPDVIVMDDAYQHRYVKPGLSILVIDYNRPLWKDVMMPAGELREPMSGKKRADVILFSKCPADISEIEQANFIRKIKPQKNQEVYFSSVGYKEIRSIFESEDVMGEEIGNTSVLVVTGIANPTPFLEYVRSKVQNVESIKFPDHYQFASKDIDKVMQRFNQMKGNRKIVLTTEKDAIRFKQMESELNDLKKHLYYIPIEIQILDNIEKEFKDKIINYVEQNKRKR